MVEKQVKITHSKDHEFELATMIVNLASRFNSLIYIVMKNKKVNAKSMMGMMSLGLMEDDEIIVTAEGNDETDAAECLVQLLHR